MSIQTKYYIYDLFYKFTTDIRGKNYTFKNVFK